MQLSFRNRFCINLFNHFPDWRWFRQSLKRYDSKSVTKLVEHHLCLDEEIDKRLREVIDETESASMSLMIQVRKLSDEAGTLVDYLGNSTMKAGSFDQMIQDSVDNITKIDQFVAELPEQKRREMAVISTVAEKISLLGNLTEAIKDISRKTDIVAINASIEAQHAGKAGQTFKVLANEVRQLAERSGAAATKIEHGLEATRCSIEDSLKIFMDESSKQMKEAEIVSESIRRLQEDYEDMRQYYRTLFAVVTEHNTGLAMGIVDVLGQFQFQDVVRQRIERIEIAVSKRNEVLRALPLSLGDSENGTARLSGELRMVLENYLAEESCHASAADDAAETGLPRIELF